MEKYLIIFLALFFTNCKSQSQIIDILDDDGSHISNAYYKDINNLLDPYTGTWIYSSGNRYIKMVLTKKIKFYDGKSYEDDIIGGVEYKENGVTKVNTLSYINNTSFVNTIQYPISGRLLFDKDFYPKCPECPANELRLQLTYKEPGKAGSGRLVLRRISINGQEALKIEHRSGTIMYKDGEPLPEAYILPDGNFVFVKQ